MDKQRHAGVLALENIGKAIELAAGVDTGKPHPQMAELMLGEARRWADMAKQLQAYEAGHTGALCGLAQVGQILLREGDRITARHAAYLANTVLNAYAMREGMPCLTADDVEAKVFRTSVELLEDELASSR